MSALAVLWGAAVGASLVASALIAVRLRLPERAAAVATTFGGGLLLAALAFELVPEADERGALVDQRRLRSGHARVPPRGRLAHP